MKHRSLLITTLALLLVLLVAGTAQADTPSRHFVSGAPHQARAVTSPSSVVDGTRLGAPLNPFGVAGSGTAVLNGTVYDGTMAPVNGATVDWWAQSAGLWNNGEVITGTDGTYSFTAAVAANGEGELWAFSPDTTNAFMYERYGASWLDPGPTTFDFQAGIVPLTAYRGGPWDTWSSCTFVFEGSDAQTAIWSAQDIDSSNTSASPVVYSGNVLAGSYTSGSVRFWSDEGLEISPPSVSAGGTASGVTVYEAAASRTFVWAPWWGSGKPGTPVKVAMGNFPAGWTLDFSGHSDWPASAPVKTFSSTNTTGVANQYRTLTVPTTAKPGYDYWIGEQHEGGALYLETAFQVCTFKSTRLTVHRGASVVFSGIVPTQGHQGSTLGKHKTVTIWAHTGNANVPTVWNPSSKGWYKVASLTCSGTGAFHSGKIHDNRAETVTVVARYAGDNWYWGAYTSKLKLTVLR